MFSFKTKKDKKIEELEQQLELVNKLYKIEKSRSAKFSEKLYEINELLVNVLEVE